MARKHLSSTSAANLPAPGYIYRYFTNWKNLLSSQTQLSSLHKHRYLLYARRPILRAEAWGPVLHLTLDGRKKKTTSPIFLILAPSATDHWATIATSLCTGLTRKHSFHLLNHFVIEILNGFLKNKFCDSKYLHGIITEGTRHFAAKNADKNRSKWMRQTRSFPPRRDHRKQRDRKRNLRKNSTLRNLWGRAEFL